jgi:hypothetical protein
MSRANKIVVTVTVEEIESSKSNETPNPKELWASVSRILKKRIIDRGMEILRRFIW